MSDPDKNRCVSSVTVGSGMSGTVRCDRIAGTEHVHLATRRRDVFYGKNGTPRWGETEVEIRWETEA